MQVVVTALFIVLVCSFSAIAQAPEPALPAFFDKVYLAKDDGSGNPGEEAVEFLLTDVPIHCVVLLSTDKPVTVKMDLIAENVPGVKPALKVISTSFTTDEMQDRVYFNGRPKKVWFPGVYRADIYIDGVLAGKFPFTVKGLAAAQPPASNFQPKASAKRAAAGKKPE